jgi:hypothetical protein
VAAARAAAEAAAAERAAAALAAAAQKAADAPLKWERRYGTAALPQLRAPSLPQTKPKAVNLNAPQVPLAFYLLLSFALTYLLLLFAGRHVDASYVDALGMHTIKLVCYTELLYY